MNILEIIAKKRDGKELSKEEIKYFIKGYVEGKIEDYQASALIMAIYINGMTNKEISDLTLEMARSGKTLDLTSLNEIIVDKHSTGGVGDKVSLILCPLLASLGIKVAKMSGRGLGFTGGTVDKIESIPGYKTEIQVDEFIANVEKIGVSMIAQTSDLAPADKKIYELRNSISCVDSIPLIASSIMSKKIASGAERIVIDVTIGSGAFMKTIEDGRRLARKMINIGKEVNREVICVLTNMDEPLGNAVGNSLEIIEVIESLKGKIPEDIKEVVLELGSYMMQLAGRGEDIKENKKKLLENIINGKAYSKFIEMIKNQGGDIAYIENTDKFEKAKYIEEVKATKTGYIQKINAEEIGKLASYLGAGRIRKKDEIDKSVGIILNTKVGEEIRKGNTIATIYANDKVKLEKAKEKIIETILIENKPINKNSTILEVIS